MRVRTVLTIAGILLASNAWAQWNIQTVDNSSNTGTRTGIAYDAEGYPHISYSDNNGNVYHACWTGHAWQIDRVYSGNTNWQYPPTAVFVDGSGTVHVAHGAASSSYERMYYSKKVGGVWTSWIVESLGWGYDGTIGLCVGADGVPHISYASTSPHVLRHAYKPASTWITETVDGAASVGTFSSITCDASGHLYIAYSDDGGGDLKFAYYDGSAWSTQIVDMPGTVATYGVSIKLDGSGNPCVAYYDQTNGDLKYARFTGTLDGKSGFGPAGQK